MKTKKIYYCVEYFLIVGFMILLAFWWNNMCNEKLYDGSRCFFLENRIQDLKDVILPVFEEEFIWRVIPISLTCLIIWLMPHKWLKYTFSILCFIGIICVQVIFGAKHHSQLSDYPVWYNIFQQGGTGIILAISYIGVLYLVFYRCSTRIKKNNIIKILIPTVLAFCASCIIHATSNALIVIHQTF